MEVSHGYSVRGVPRAGCPSSDLLAPTFAEEGLDDVAAAGEGGRKRGRWRRCAASCTGT